MIVFPDSNLVASIIHPRANVEAKAVKDWATTLISRGSTFYIAEIVDYETRRKLLHIRSTISLMRLDQLVGSGGFGYEALTTEAMRHAAQLWAEARQRGKATAGDRALDGDVILSAQVLGFQNTKAQGEEVIVATTNLKHLTLFVTARRWEDIAL